MGTYLNPGNAGFQRILQSEYVDKTGLIALLNQGIGTMGNLTCVSRPRRFGKSYAAKMDYTAVHDRISRFLKGYGFSLSNRDFKFGVSRFGWHLIISYDSVFCE